MKKLLMFLMAGALALSAQALTVDWKVTGTAGYTVYLMAGDAVATWASAEAVQNAALASGTIAASGRSAFYGTTTTDAALTKSANFYIVALTADKKQYAVSASFNGKDYAYDTTATPAESSPATAQWAAASATYTPFKEDPEEPIPEPTSGLLLVLGLAGLALKRKHA